MVEERQDQERRYGEVSEGVTSMAELVMSEQSLSSVVDLVLNIVVGTIDGAAAAGIALKRSERLATVGRTSPIVDQLDDARDQGPTIYAFTTGEAVVVADASADERWPAFSAKAAEQGVVSTLAIPLRPVDVPVGVLTIHAARAGVFDEPCRRTAETLARQAAIAIANAGSFVASEETNDQLRDALQSRDLIGQAKGILMERDGVAADEAFDQIRGESQRTNRKLRDVAADIVRRVLDRGAP